MIDAYLELIARYSRSGVLVDTQILLLYFVGRIAPAQIRRFKRTEMFDTDDFTLLTNLLGRFERIVTTPNVLSEVSNLSGQLGEPLRTSFFGRLRTEICELREEYVSSREIAGENAFVRFGLTDGAIHLLAQTPHLVLTGDAPLFNFLQSRRIDAMNFNHVRPYGWRWLAGGRNDS